MIFGYVGICYKEAPLALRGQVALPDSKKIELFYHLLKKNILDYHLTIIMIIKLIVLAQC